VLSSRALYRGLLWSLVVVIPTFFLGRLFCGWVCPMGTLNHFFGSLKSEPKRGKQLIESNRYKPRHATKYYTLPIAKHHSFTGTTLGMKNWYGILGGQRRRSHQRIHESLDLADFVRPTLTLIDSYPCFSATDLPGATLTTCC
jgi:hypothetical protein